MKCCSLPQFAWPLARRRRPSDGRLIEAVHDAAADFRTRSDESLRAETDVLRAKVRDGAAATEPEVLVPAFALVVEATRRVLGLTLFDVQLLAGLALARGAIAEMATGEGKTLTAALPSLLHALSGHGVHVATPNAYLAQRDHRRVGPILGLLGASVGLVPESAGPDEKRAAYACDVTYATGYELGFDYLRDQLRKLRTPRPQLGEIQRGLLRGRPHVEPPPIQPRRAFAIIDEIDSVLIDEACLPLVLSDGDESDQRLAAVYDEARQVADALACGEDFLLDDTARTVTLTRQGLQKIYDDYSARLRLELQRPWAVYVQQAICADWLHRRDVDYVIQEGKARLVDEFTGRIFPDRSWRDGLHQAVEAKEGLRLTPELRTAARISRQRFFLLYDRICGMTGTASGSRREFRRHYRLPVVQIPLRKPCRREVLPTRFFTDAESKYRAITQEAAGQHAAGRPVLVGARTIENSRRLAGCFEAAGIPFQLLNGTQDREEAEIIAGAGRAAVVTLATNMAGRGTDIELGPGVATQGGMHVIGVECHESQRIDRQLLGRAGRQGDPGSGRMFVSADDALLGRFGPQLCRRMQRLADGDGEVRRDLSRDVAAVQHAAETAAYAGRRQLLALDDWLDGFLKAVGDGG